MHMTFFQRVAGNAAGKQLNWQKIHMIYSAKQQCGELSGADVILQSESCNDGHSDIMPLLCYNKQ